LLHPEKILPELCDPVIGKAKEFKELLKNELPEVKKKRKENEL